MERLSLRICKKNKKTDSFDDIVKGFLSVLLYTLEADKGKAGKETKQERTHVVLHSLIFRIINHGLAFIPEGITIHININLFDLDLVAFHVHNGGPGR